MKNYCNEHYTWKFNKRNFRKMPPYCRWHAHAFRLPRRIPIGQFRSRLSGVHARSGAVLIASMTRPPVTVRARMRRNTRTSWRVFARSCVHETSSATRKRRWRFYEKETVNVQLYTRKIKTSIEVVLVHKKHQRTENLSSTWSCILVQLWPRW